LPPSLFPADGYVEFAPDLENKAARPTHKPVRIEFNSILREISSIVQVKARDSVSVARERRDRGALSFSSTFTIHFHWHTIPARLEGFEFPVKPHGPDRKQGSSATMYAQSTPDSLCLPPPMEDPAMLRSPPPVRGRNRYQFPNDTREHHQHSPPRQARHQPEGLPSPAVAAIFANINQKASRLGWRADLNSDSGILLASPDSFQRRR
jgi:hypothetical protein